MAESPRLHDPHAEQALIGAALLDASVPDRVSLEPRVFLDSQCQRAWRAILELRAEGTPLDTVLIEERAQIPLPFLGQCAMATPTADNAEHYADVVRRHALTRAVLRAVGEIGELHRRGKAEGAELLGAALQKITAIDIDRPQRALAIGDLVKERFAELDRLVEARATGQEVFTGVPTGLEPLDNLLSGIQPGIVTLLAGRPAMGKSALAQAIADAASELGHGVHVFSLEDARSAYADRVMARGARVPTERIRTGRLQRQDMEPMTLRAAALCKRHNWLYDDVSSISADEIVRAVRRERVANDTRLVVVDYLQIVRRPRRYENKNDAIEQNISILAEAARHDGIAYLVLSQLSREVERREDKRPRLSDLRDSGTLEERAKCVLAVYRGSVYGDPAAGIDYADTTDDQRPTDLEWRERMDVLVLKNSHGATGYVRCRWDGPCTRVH